MVALVVIVTVLLGLHGVAAEDGIISYCVLYILFSSSLSTECVRIIREYDEDEYEELTAEPMKNPGFYCYMLPCGGIVTSVEARGFCGRPDNVELRLISGVRANHSFKDVTSRILLPAKCNRTAMVDNNYEGYVSATGLNITVPRNGTLAVQLNPDCTETKKCFFQPAVISETSNYDVLFADSHLVWSHTNTSLFFSANITGNCRNSREIYTLLWFLQTELPDEENKRESYVLYVIIGVLCFLLLCGTLGIIALSIKRWSKMKTPVKLLHCVNFVCRCGSKIYASVEIPTSTNEAYWKVERKKGNELFKINGEPAAKSEEMMYDVVLSPAPSSRPLPTIPFPLSGGTEEEEDCTTAVYEVIPGDHGLDY